MMRQMPVAFAPAPGSANDCPQPGPHYFTEVNKGSINMGAWTNRLNNAYRSGYRLHSAFEQHGNTIMIFEHRHPPL